MIEDRWMKNSERVRKICKTMGLKLVGFDPSWSVAQGNKELSNNPFITWANDSMGMYLQIPDEFMANVSLMMGYGWDFVESDEDLNKSINQIKSIIKTISKPTDVEALVNTTKGKGKKIRELQNIDAEIKEMRKADIQDYEQRIARLNFVLETRNRLKNWSNDN